MTRRLILQKARHHPLTGSDFLWACGFRFSFTPLPGFFSPFPLGTCSLSVTREYLALGDGPPRFRRNFTCSAVLRIHSGENELLTTGLLPSSVGLSKPLRLIHSFVTPYRVSYNPKRQASWFGLFPFRSPLLRESNFLSLPAGTKMFQFSASTSNQLCIH